MATPILDAIKKAAQNMASGSIPNAGFSSGFNKILTPPLQSAPIKVQSLEMASKATQQMTGGSSTLKGPRATTNLNSANVANYKPSIGGTKL